MQGSRTYLAWTIVNFLIVLFSLSLYIDLQRGEEDRSERPGAIVEYLIYNLTVALVAVVEVSLEIYDLWKSNTPLSNANLIEGALDLYFVYDAAHLVFAWKLDKIELDDSEDDALLGLVVYSFLTFESYKQYKKSKQRVEYEEVSEDLFASANGEFDGKF
mmetsp:Transcript_18510/g.45846  ORF Transcript_18510/g.45846 Transcript_18510/m.45846 type:complete len:160 (-) Transcript_18510:1704-2183(-)